MHNHDPELIAALAEGSLAADVAAAAAEDIAECTACSADLQANRFALETISSVPAPTLTRAEAAHLRDAVAAALSIESALAPEQRPARRTPWAAIAITAVSLAGIVAVVPVLGLLSATEDDGASTTAAVAFELQDTEEAASEEMRNAPVAAVEDDAAADVEEAELGAAIEAPAVPEGEGLTSAPPQTTTTAGAPVTTTAAAETAPAEVGLPPIISEPDLDRILADGLEDRDLLTDETLLPDMPCYEAAGNILGADRLRLAPIVRLNDGRVGVAYVDAERIEMAVFAADDCTAVLILP